MLVAKYASEYKAPGSEPISFSDQRAIKAQEWVEKEVDKLMNNIIAISKRNQSTGKFEVTFGELFYTYQDISDTLVGIMVRAKKRGLIEYEGEGGHMLLQGRHDKVIVTVTKAGEDMVLNRKPISSSSSTTLPKLSLPPRPIISSEKKTVQNKNNHTTNTLTNPVISPSSNPIKNQDNEQSTAKTIALTGFAVILGLVSTIVEGNDTKNNKTAS